MACAMEPHTTLVVKALPRSASSTVLSPKKGRETIDATQTALEELQQRLAEEVDQRSYGQQRLEQLLHALYRERQGGGNPVAEMNTGASWWDIAAGQLAALEDRMTGFAEKLKDLTSAHNELVIATDGRAAEEQRREKLEASVERLSAEVQRLVEDRLTLRHTEELAALAKEQLRSQTAEVQGVLQRWEQRFETLRAHIEAEASFRISGETKRRMDSEKLLTSLLGDLSEIQREFHINTESAEAAQPFGTPRRSAVPAKAGFLRRGASGAGAEPNKDPEPARGLPGAILAPPTLHPRTAAISRTGPARAPDAQRSILDEGRPASPGGRSYPALARNAVRL